ncbi:MAG: tRNA epoxyqueuosine(34) reductase QueG [Bacteroidales bacterium]|nr:tRNA epoxyqueuosine(34) reductase QueG [Bacteroidales bacterium]
MDELTRQSSLIKAAAQKMGFDACGISRVARLDEEAKRLDSWLENHYHGSMTYMENHREKRVDPSLLVKGAQSVISVILNYFPEKKQEDPEAPVISKYAYGRDYHKVIRDRLYLLLRYINEEITPASGRAFTDSAPVLDKVWAARAGLGWIGKNTCLISRKLGSFVFIGELVVTIPLRYDNPIRNYCGTCTKCIEACPTHAIIAPGVLDARRCISYLTIENKGDIDDEFRKKLGNRVFGCDVCQEVCPWNHKAVPHQMPELEPVPGLLEMTRDDWQELAEEEFNLMFGETALKRPGFAGLRRNLAAISATTDA